jgi:hypothetical protein
MTAGLLLAGVIIFAMAVAGVWLMQYAEAEPAARAIGRAPDPAEEQEARDSVSTPRSSILAERGQQRGDRAQAQIIGRTTTRPRRLTRRGHARPAVRRPRSVWTSGIAAAGVVNTGIWHEWAGA